MEQQTNRLSWATAANIATFLSIFLSIGAIALSFWQFDRSLQELYQERKLRNEENRPLITIDSMGVSIFDFVTEYKEAPSWSYTFRMRNAGVRPAAKLSVKSWVVGRSFFINDSTYEASGRDTFNFANSIAKDITINYVGDVKITPKNHYYIKIALSYADPLTHNIYKDTSYYSTDLLTPLRYKDDHWPIFEIDRSDVHIVNGLVDKLHH